MTDTTDIKRSLNCPKHYMRYERECNACEPLRRAQSMSQKLTAKHPHWPIFGGLTLSGRFHTGKYISPLNVMPYAREWISLYEDALKRPIFSLIGVEGHALGVPHFHPVISLDGAVTDDELRLGERIWIELTDAKPKAVKLEHTRKPELALPYAIKAWLTSENGDLIIYPEKDPFGRHVREVQAKWSQMA